MKYSVRFLHAAFAAIGPESKDMVMYNRDVNLPLNNR